MTWKEFKAKVEAEMEERGITDDTDLWYIDVAFPDTVEIDLDLNVGLFIR